MIIRFGLSALTVCLFLTTGAKADPMATQTFANLGLTTADSSTTGDINTSTSFMIGALTSTVDNTGNLAGMPTQTFAPFTFSITNPTSLTFGNSVFGTFTSTSITAVANNPAEQTLNLNVLGNWTPGTFGGVTGGPFASELAISMFQVPGPRLAGIVASGSFSTPAVPEPSTWSLFAISFAALGGVVWRRRGTSGR